MKKNIHTHWILNRRHSSHHIMEQSRFEGSQLMKHGRTHIGACITVKENIKGKYEGKNSHKFFLLLSKTKQTNKEEREALFSLLKQAVGKRRRGGGWRRSGAVVRPRAAASELWTYSFEIFLCPKLPLLLLITFLDLFLKECERNGLDLHE